MVGKVELRDENELSINAIISVPGLSQTSGLFRYEVCNFFIEPG